MNKDFNMSFYRPKELRTYSLAALMCLPVITSAGVADATEANKTRQLDKITVSEKNPVLNANPYASVASPFKAEIMSSDKYTQPIVKTPKSLTVLTKESISQTGANDLSDVVKKQPAITIGTGEGGNAFGDRFIIRGFEARNDVFVDGLRDPGVTTRDIFAVEQVEISKGASSSFAGRGTTGGAINSVTKKPNIESTFTQTETTIGTDNRQKQTVDTNWVLDDGIALRTNLMVGRRDVPARDGVSEDRKGAAIAGTARVNDKLTLDADLYYHQSDDTPDGGVPWDAIADKPVASEQYFGQDNRDYWRTESKIATVGAKYRFNPEWSIGNKTRYGKTSNEYVVSVPGLRATGVPSGTKIGLATPDVYAISSGKSRNQDNIYVGNQTDIRLDTKDFSGRMHNVVLGAEISQESIENLPFSDTQSSVNAGNPLNPHNNAWTGKLSANKNGYAELDVDTKSTYLMDTWTLNDTWQVSGGVRYDRFDYTVNSGATAYEGKTNGQIKHQEGFFNYNAGIVYSPWENGNIYLAYGTSTNPTGEQLDSFTNCSYGGLCKDGKGNIPDPSTAKNIELGTKWDVLDNRLLLTGAVFQTTKDNVTAVVGSGVNSTFNQVGELRVQGLEIGASGKITDRLDAQIGASILDTEVTKSVKAADVGKKFPNTAEKSAYVQTNYAMTDKWSVGGTANYVGTIYGGTPDGGATDKNLPAHVRFDLTTAYDVTDHATLRLSVLNVTDKRYYEALYRSATPFTYVGEGRSAYASLSYKF